jgi:hypothetical protein
MCSLRFVGIVDCSVISIPQRLVEPEKGRRSHSKARLFGAAIALSRNRCVPRGALRYLRKLQGCYARACGVILVRTPLASAMCKNFA